MIDVNFAALFEQVRPYLWILMLFITLAAMVRAPWFQRLIGKGGEQPGDETPRDQ